MSNIIKTSFFYLLIITMFLVVPVKVFAVGPLYRGYYYPTVLYPANRSSQEQNLSNKGYGILGYNNDGSYDILHTLYSDAIMYIDTHGPDWFDQYGNHLDSGGAFFCYSGNQTPADAGNPVCYGTANEPSIVPLSIPYYSFDHFYTNSTALSAIRLAYFSMCYSGANETVFGLGNLAKRAADNGALCSVGFVRSISINPSQDFDTIFFKYATGSDSSHPLHDIQNALWSTLTDIKQMYNNNTGGLESYEVYQPKGVMNKAYNIYLVPAKYGNQ